MIYIITRHKTHATIDCPPAGNALLRHTSAIFHGKNWYVETDQIDAITTWLKAKGHTPLTVTDTNRPDDDKLPTHCHHGLRWGHLLNPDHVSVGGCNQCEWRAPDTGNVVPPHTPDARPFDFTWWDQRTQAKARGETYP